jgi:hypothetical protein
VNFTEYPRVLMPANTPEALTPAAFKKTLG